MNYIYVMDRILRWKNQKNGSPWYFNNNDNTTNIINSNFHQNRNVIRRKFHEPMVSTPPIVSTPPMVSMPYKKKVPEKPPQEKPPQEKPPQEKPEWAEDEKAILQGDRFSSYSYGGGRFGNQIIRNLAMAMIAEKFDLIIRYQRSEEIEKLGFKLFSGKLKYDKHKVITEKNYYYILNKKNLHYNIRSQAAPLAKFGLDNIALVCADDFQGNTSEYVAKAKQGADGKTYAQEFVEGTSADAAQLGLLSQDGQLTVNGEIIEE